MAKKQFKAESKRLLDLMINSIYTHREIFLREIISNASDAMDKLAYLALTDEKVGLNRDDFAITLTRGNGTLTVSDNGIGMTKEELLEASIEMEVKKVSAAMTKVAVSDLPADKKIIKLVFTRLQMTRNIVRRNGCLHNDYIIIVEHIRKGFDTKEIALFRHIISEGNQKGIFNSESPDLAARFLHFCLKGIELPFINGMINRNNDDKLVHQFTERVILNALGHKKTTEIQ